MSWNHFWNCILISNPLRYFFILVVYIIICVKKGSTFLNHKQVDCKVNLQAMIGQAGLPCRDKQMWIDKASDSNVNL